MAKRYIDVVTKHPGEDFCQTRIENSLEALRDFVGGYIEVVEINPYACIICNLEGRLKGLKHCISFHKDLFRGDLSFYGPIIMAGVDGDEFDDFPVPATQCNAIWKGAK